MGRLVNMRVKQTNKIINNNFLASCKSLSENTKLPFSVFFFLIVLSLISSLEGSSSSLMITVGGYLC